MPAFEGQRRGRQGGCEQALCEVPEKMVTELSWGRILGYVSHWSWDRSMAVGQGAPPSGGEGGGGEPWVGALPGGCCHRVIDREWA